jgi:N-acetylmuramoyl-L-alanine amidase
MTALKSPLVIDKSYRSPNRAPRRRNSDIFALVLHYTALGFEKSLEVLTDPKTQVSAHYLVPENAIDKERKVFQLVPENEQAWQAGKSEWQGDTCLNNNTIGIEIVNLGYKDENNGRHWYPFSDYQIASVMELSKRIIKRYAIHPTCVIGHSDIAPGRKVDPGPLFPWKKLYENGVGTWFNEPLIVQSSHQLDIVTLQENLQDYGYAIEITGIVDEQTRIALQAFQMHFRPSDYSGDPDAETLAILENLLQRYFSS